MTNPSEFQGATEPHHELTPPWPFNEGDVSLVGCAEAGSDEILEEKLQRLHDGYDEIRQLLDKMDRLFKRCLTGIATVTSV